MWTTCITTSIRAEQSCDTVRVLQKVQLITGTWMADEMTWKILCKHWLKGRTNRTQDFCDGGREKEGLNLGRGFFPLVLTTRVLACYHQWNDRWVNAVISVRSHLHSYQGAHECPKWLSASTASLSCNFALSEKCYNESNVWAIWFHFTVGFEQKHFKNQWWWRQFQKSHYHHETTTVIQEAQTVQKHFKACHFLSLLKSISACCVRRCFWSSLVLEAGLLCSKGA